MKSPIETTARDRKHTRLNGASDILGGSNAWDLILHEKWNKLDYRNQKNIFFIYNKRWKAQGFFDPNKRKAIIQRDSSKRTFLLIKLSTSSNSFIIYTIVYDGSKFIIVDHVDVKMYTIGEYDDTNDDTNAKSSWEYDDTNAKKISNTHEIYQDRYLCFAHCSFTNI